MATLSVTSTPAGANVYIDGRDTGKRTPAQVSVDKGQHVVLVRMGGYIDETTERPIHPGSDHQLLAHSALAGQRR